MDSTCRNCHNEFTGIVIACPCCKSSDIKIIKSK